MVPLHRNGTPKTDVGTRDRSICFDRLDQVSVWRNVDLGLWIGKW